ncbi:hypothetical protein DL96DRAFT_120646 [Flagelloscypha sp. PMI_526]|nr:hypothetical protein DL96DRAFT_120646 [Flagelloscypha sp. PMI_526]
MSHFVELAPELLHQILSWSDKKTLLACATTSRLIHHVSRNLLFNVILIGKHHSDTLTAILEDGFPHKHLVTEITVQFHLFNQDRKRFIDFITALQGYRRLRTLQLITRSSQQSEKEIKMINELLDNSTFGTYQVRLFGRLGSCGSNNGGYPSVYCPVLTDMAVGSNWDWHPLQSFAPWPHMSPKKFQRPRIHTLRVQTVPQSWPKLEKAIDLSQIQRLSLPGQTDPYAVETSLLIIETCSPSFRVLSIFHTSREPFPADSFTFTCPSLTRLILWTGYPPFPFRSWIIPMINIVSDLAPNLYHLDLYIQLPQNDLRTNLRSTFGDLQETSQLLKSISSLKKNFRVVRFWFWEKNRTLEDENYLEKAFKHLIHENGWDGSVSFVWGVSWTDIWPFCDDPIDRWF